MTQVLKSMNVAEWAGYNLGHDVLLVDDDRDVLESTAELLDDLGYSTTCASSAAEALRLIDKGLEPSVMLVDVQMPEMSGDAFLAQCAKRPGLSEVPRVLLSGGRVPQRVVRDSGALALVSKPFGDRQLSDVLDRAFHPAH